MADGDEDYLAREARARKEIDQQLVAAGWVVQPGDKVNLRAGAGVAVREFVLSAGHGRADYMLFVGGEAVGVIEAKPEGTTLTEVELQSGKYTSGLPPYMKPSLLPLPFIYESTGKETRFTNGYDPDARSRTVFTFFRPETLSELARQIKADRGEPTLRARLRSMPRAGRGRAVERAGYGHPQPRTVPARGPAPGAHPDGHRIGQDVHRREHLLPAHPATRMPSASCSWSTGRTSGGRPSWSSTSSPSRKPSASSPPNTTCST